MSDNSLVITPSTRTASRSMHGNFRDPGGLVMRMLKSGSPAARQALLREGLKPSALPFDFAMQLWERRIIAQSESTNDYPLVLIVGAPRSGTTLIYQALARYCNVCFLPNMSALFPRSPISASRLCYRLLREPVAPFHSYYGQTTRMAGANDAFHVWNRWLGNDRYLTPEDFTTEQCDDMRSFFGAMTSAFKQPFLNKNNRNTTCIRFLADTLPQAHFVVVRRNPVYVAQSLILARRQIQGDVRSGWGLACREDAGWTDALGYVDDIAHQLLSIENVIQSQLNGIARDRVVEVTYEDFCETPRDVIQSVVDATPGLSAYDARIDAELQSFERSERLHLSAGELERFQAIMHQRPDCCVRKGGDA